MGRPSSPLGPCGPQWTTWTGWTLMAANSFHIAIGVNANHSGVNPVENSALTPA